MDEVLRTNGRSALTTRWISSGRSTLTDEPRPVHVSLPEGGRDTGKLVNRARYIATRPGVEVLRGEHSDQPATKKQQAYIQRLLRDFPGAEELLEYEDYRNAPTQQAPTLSFAKCKRTSWSP